MKSSSDFRPAHYKCFKAIRKMLLIYGKAMVIEIDQMESFYMTFPNECKIPTKAGTLFAAIQIRENAVDFHLNIMMDHPNRFLRGSSDSATKRVSFILRA